jgi:hypothetical protein
MTKFSELRVSEYSEIEGAAILEARLENGEWWFHQGPKVALFWSLDEARKLQDRVAKRGEIDLQYWEPSSNSWEELEISWEKENPWD